MHSVTQFYLCFKTWGSEQLSGLTNAYLKDKGRYKYLMYSFPGLLAWAQQCPTMSSEHSSPAVTHTNNKLHLVSIFLRFSGPHGAEGNLCNNTDKVESYIKEERSISQLYLLVPCYQRHQSYQCQMMPNRRSPRTKANLQFSVCKAGMALLCPVSSDHTRPNCLTLGLGWDATGRSQDTPLYSYLLHPSIDHYKTGQQTYLYARMSKRPEIMAECWESRCYNVGNSTEHVSIKKVHVEVKQRSLDEVENHQLDYHDARRMLDGRRDHRIEGCRAHKWLPEIGVYLLIVSCVIDEYVLSVEI